MMAVHLNAGARAPDPPGADVTRLHQAQERLGSESDAERIWRVALDEFREADAAYRQKGLSDDEWDKLCDRADATRDRLFALPAPDVAALAEKLRLSLRVKIEDRPDDDVDDPRTIAAGLAGPLRPQVQAYQDALRLAGQRPEIAEATPFDPDPFIAAVTAAGVGLSIKEDDSTSYFSVPFFTPIRGCLAVPANIQRAFESLRQRELDVIKERLKDMDRGTVQ